MRMQIFLSVEEKRWVLPDVTRRATQTAKIASFDVILTDASQDWADEKAEPILAL
jgi:hypothetical protein